MLIFEKLDFVKVEGHLTLVSMGFRACQNEWNILSYIPGPEVVKLSCYVSEHEMYHAHKCFRMQILWHCIYDIYFCDIY